MREAFVSLAFLAAVELAAFPGLRLAVRAQAHRRLSRVIGLLYWLVSAAVLGLVIAAVLFGPRDAIGGPRIPDAVIVAAVAVYLPKTVLAVLTSLELLRVAVSWLVRRAIGRTPAAANGWLGRIRLLPRLGLALAAATFGAILWGATLGRSDVAVHRYELRSASLPVDLDGLRVAHLSDIHISSLGVRGARLADRLVEAVSRERPDLIVFTGDYGEPTEFAAGPDVLGRLRAPLGKFAVLGNHDFGGKERAADNWTSPEDKRRKTEALGRAFRSRGFTLLMNEASIVSRGHGAIAILGVGVWDPHHGFDDADLAAAERAARNTGFRVLLAHSPQYWESAVQGKREIALTLVGHTHGAQVGLGIGPLVWSPAALEFRHWGGLYREGRQYLNVNRGTGYVGLPLRINMPADVSLIVLRSAGTALL